MKPALLLSLGLLACVSCSEQKREPEVLGLDQETGSIGVDREHGHALIYGISPDN